MGVRRGCSPPTASSARVGCDFVAPSVIQIGLGMHNLQADFAHHNLPVHFFSLRPALWRFFLGRAYIMDGRAGERRIKLCDSGYCNKQGKPPISVVTHCVTFPLTLSTMYVACNLLAYYCQELFAVSVKFYTFSSALTLLSH